jgi:hypothetical protein
MADDLLRKKDFPLNYPQDVLNLISIMAYDTSKVKIVGSMSLKSQQYAGDYDMYEIVNGAYKNKDTAVSAYVKAFQDKIRQLMKTKDCYIGDIKAGIIKDWEVIPESSGILNGKIKGYDATKAKAKLEELASNKILTEEEVKYARGLIVEKPSVNEFVLMKKELRFHLVRWKPDEVLKGVVKLRDGSDYTLEEAFQAPAIVKLDVIAFVENSRFTDFSIIYLFKNKGKAINNVDLRDEEFAVKQDIVFYLASGNYFKVAKRMFSIARIKDDVKMLKSLNEMLNGDLGRLYSILSDLGTLIYLYENESSIPEEKIQYELDQVRSRLGNIYSLGGVNSPAILERLLSASSNKKKVLKTLYLLSGRFEKVLASESKKEMNRLKLLPLKKGYTP